MGSNQDCLKASSELASYHMKIIITSNMHQITSEHISKKDATCEHMPDDGSWTSNNLHPYPRHKSLVTLYRRTSSAAFIKKKAKKKKKKKSS